MKFEFNNVEMFVNDTLAMQLDSLVYNLKNDWDFMIIITGDRTVRVGKSVLGMTVSAYLGYRLQQLKMNLNPYTLDDVYFNSEEMIKKAIKKPKFSINHYDEGRESLAAVKAMKNMQIDLIDFFTECGQLNQIFVIVLPDFFTLKEDIAVPRSEFLINVYRTEEKKMIDLYNDGVKRPIVKLKRGRFEFFNRATKKNLYDKAKVTHRKNYGLIKANFLGTFSSQYPFPKEDYEKKKRKALERVKKEGKRVMPLMAERVLRIARKHVDKKDWEKWAEEESLEKSYVRSAFREYLKGKMPGYRGNP